METKEYQIIGLHCQHCVKRVESALSELEGVRSVSVSKDNNLLRIDADYLPSLQQINTLLESQGEYRVSETPVK